MALLFLIFFFLFRFILIVILFLFVFCICVFHFFVLSVFQVLKFPKSVALSFPVFGEGFLYQNNIRELQIFALEIINLTDISICQVVSKDCIIEIKYFPEVSIYNISLIVFTKILLSGYFNLHLSKSLSYCGSA